MLNSIDVKFHSSFAFRIGIDASLYFLGSSSLQNLCGCRPFSCRYPVIFMSFWWISQTSLPNLATLAYHEEYRKTEDLSQSETKKYL